MSNSSIIDEDENVYDSAGIDLNLKNLEKFSASGCNLLTATIGKDCKKLSYLDMEYNRFGEISGGITIGDNVWKSYSFFNSLSFKTITVNESKDDETDEPSYSTTLDDTYRPTADDIKTHILDDTYAQDARGIITKTSTTYIINDYIAKYPYSTTYDGPKPLNLSTWGGYDKEGNLYLPALEDGTLKLYGNGIFIAVGADVLDSNISFAYVKTGSLEGNPVRGKASFIKNYHLKNGLFKREYYGDYWIVNYKDGKATYYREGDYRFNDERNECISAN